MWCALWAEEGGESGKDLHTGSITCYGLPYISLGDEYCYGDGDGDLLSLEKVDVMTQVSDGNFRLADSQGEVSLVNASLKCLSSKSRRGRFFVVFKLYRNSGSLCSIFSLLSCVDIRVSCNLKPASVNS